MPIKLYIMPNFMENYPNLLGKVLKKYLRNFLKILDESIYICYN